MINAATLDRKLDRFSAWFRLTRSWSILQYVLFYAALVLFVYVLIDKLLFVDLAYKAVAYTVATAGFICLAFHFLFSNKNKAYVSYLVDKQAGYKNLIATGLSVEDSEDEVSAALVERANRALDQKNPKDIIPFTMNWAGRYLAIPVALLLIAFFIPPFDLLGRQEQAHLIAAEEQAVEEGILQLKKQMTLIDKTPQDKIEGIEQSQITDDLNRLAENLMGTSKKEALLKLGEFEDKYREDFNEARDFKEMAKKMDMVPDFSGMKDESKKSLSDALKAMKDGDMKAVADAMKEMAEQLESGDLNDDEKKALAREMQKMAEDMGGEGANKDLAEKLSAMASSSPEDLAEKIQEAAEAAKEMSEFCESNEGMNQMSEGLKQAKESMSDQQFSEMDAKKIEEYMDGEAQLGQGQGQGEGQGEGQGQGQGNGTGGQGQGKGGSPLENFTPTKFKEEMSEQKINKGRILHQIFVKGVPEKGEARVEYTDAVRAAKQDATGYLARDTIPREAEEMVKKYFDELDLDPAPAPAPATPPASE